jgi:hypothetical protein
MSTLLLLVLVLLIVFFMANRNVRIQSRKRWINNKTHYVLFTVYIAFLLIALIVSEVMATKNAIAPPLRVANYKVNIENAILSGESVDPSLIFEKRTHPAPKTLKIQNSASETYIYIERKKENDGIIEEILYKPILYVLSYDLSNELTVSKPIWNENIVTIIPNEKEDIKYVSYHDSNVTNQLTKNGSQDYSGFTSMSGSNVIHLIVPKDLIIESIYPEFVHFIDE